MKYLALISLILSFSSFAKIPINFTDIKSLNPNIKRSIDQKWAASYGKAKVAILNPTECHQLKLYTRDILQKLIASSSLEAQAQDLYLYLTCNEEISAISDAQMGARTISIKHQYFKKISNEDELAFILAHELAHHLLRHEDKTEELMKQKPTNISKIMIEQEKQADKLAILLMANASYSPDSAISLIDVMAYEQQNDSSSGTHPSFEIRKNLIMGAINQYKLPFPREHKDLPSSVLSAIDTFFFLGKKMASQQPIMAWRIKVL